MSCFSGNISNPLKTPAACNMHANDSHEKNRPYTCADYRKEMQLLGLKQRLNHPELSDAERDQLLSDIRKLEVEMDMD